MISASPRVVVAMPIFQDPPSPAHAPTPTAVPGPVRLVFRMHAADEGTRIDVTYRILGPGVRFRDGARTTATLRRSHVVGQRARAIVLDASLVWEGAPGVHDVLVEGDVVEPDTGDRLAPSWTLRAAPAAGSAGDGLAMFFAVTAGMRGDGFEG